MHPFGAACVRHLDWGSPLAAKLSEGGADKTYGLSVLPDPCVSEWPSRQLFPCSFRCRPYEDPTRQISLLRPPKQQRPGQRSLEDLWTPTPTHRCSQMSWLRCFTFDLDVTSRFELAPHKPQDIHRTTKTGPYVAHEPIPMGPPRDVAPCASKPLALLVSHLLFLRCGRHKA